MKNLVAIVGRPNVGKSTLFNKITGRRTSIVDDKPGITRDRLYGKAEWVGRGFQVIDTGGIEVIDRPFQEQIKIQAQIAIEQAKVIIFVLDGREGLTGDDHFIVDLLRRSDKKIILAINKLEGRSEFDPSIWGITEFPYFIISAIHGQGIGDMLDALIKLLDFDENVQTESRKLALIGRPNSGKSSLLNALTKQNRAIVSEIAGTTRDSVEEIFTIDKQRFTIIDTAGIKRKSKLVESVEHYALVRALNSLEKSDISILLIDASKTLTHFDLRTAGYALDNRKPIILVINKWDLATELNLESNSFQANIRNQFQFLTWAPIVLVSALKGSGFAKLKKTVSLVSDNLDKRVSTNLLNEMLSEIQMIQPPPSHKQGRLNITFGKQVKARIPTFVLFVNNRNFLHFTYERYIKNQLRSYFGFEGVPLQLVFKNKRGERNE